MDERIEEGWMERYIQEDENVAICSPIRSEPGKMKGTNKYVIKIKMIY